MMVNLINYRYKRMTIITKQHNSPLHGITLKALVTVLFEYYGWDGLAERIPVNCFINDPSIQSSLKFLRKTPWARAKVEQLYLSMRRLESHDNE